MIMPTNPKFILLYGSASKNCDVNKLERGLEFSRSIAKQTIATGHGVGVLASQEPQIEHDGKNLPLVFDWEILRSIDDYIEETSGKADRTLAKVFMRTDAMQTKISEKNGMLIRKMQSYGALEIVHIESDLFSGGEYRDQQAEHTHAMVAISGGKGTYQMAEKMLARGKPVMPMDIQLGAGSEDGRGAIQLQSEMKDDPTTFLPRNHEVVKDKIYALSLDSPIWNTERIAYTTAAIMAHELAHKDDMDKAGNGPAKKIKRMLSGTPVIGQMLFHISNTAESIDKLFE